MSSGINYYVVDTETNGLKVGYHTINEISIIRVSDKVQLTKFIKCQHPERSSADALRVCNKTISDLYNGDSEIEVVETIDKFLNEDGGDRSSRCFIGHNVITFDKKFIHALYESVGKELPVDLWMDTLQMIKQYAKQNNIKSKFNLHAACDIVGVKKIVAHQHTSKADTRNNFFLYRDLIDNKQFNYLPFIKTFIHKIGGDDGEYLDPDLLD